MRPTLLTPEDLAEQLTKLPGWEVVRGELTKTYEARSFSHALLFINAAGNLAEAADHHPELRLHSYKKVTVRLSTHSAGGLTVKDIRLAQQIDALPRKAPKSKRAIV